MRGVVRKGSAMSGFRRSMFMTASGFTSAWMGKIEVWGALELFGGDALLSYVTIAGR